MAVTLTAGFSFGSFGYARSGGYLAGFGGAFGTLSAEPVAGEIVDSFVTSGGTATFSLQGDTTSLGAITINVNGSPWINAATGTYNAGGDVTDYEGSGQFVNTTAYSVEKPAGGPVTGAVSFAFTASGALQGQGALSGSTAPAFTTAGTLRGLMAASGATTLTFTTAGDVTGAGVLSGITSLTFAPAGILQGLVQASGSTTLTFTTSATGITVGALSGASALTFTAAGAFAGAGRLSGATTTTFTTAGALRGAAPLSGASSLAFTANGAVTGSGSLSGAITVTFTTGAAPEAPASAISGSVEVSFTASGTLTATSETQNLHGRPIRRRGKVVRFFDEIDAPAEILPPVPTERKEALVEYGDLLAQVRELTALFEAGQRKRQSEAKQAALQAKINTLDARIAELAKVEQNWINRLREEDELFLLAA